MSEYWVCYRLHGPTEISEKHSIGDGTIRPSPNPSSIAGNLELTFTADNLDHARKRAKTDIRDKATRIVGALVFTLDKGLIVGDHYKIRPIDAPNKSKIDATSYANSQILEIADRVFQNINKELEANDRTRRALNWYSIGLSTETPEDRLIAFWTGLEAAATEQSQDFSYTEKQKEIIYNAKDDFQSTFKEENSDLKDWVNGIFGTLLSGVQSEDPDDQVTRILKNEVNKDYVSGIDDLENVVGTLYEARNAIVHAGISIDDPASKAGDARKLLRELLLSRLNEAFRGFINDDIPDRNRYSIFTIPKEWLPLVFENNESLELTTEEIRARAFAISRDFQEAYSFPINKLAGEGKILTKVGENTYKLSST